jgi:hypothetical protein
MWKIAQVVVGYILLKANIPIINLSCKWCSYPPPKEKKWFWVLAFNACEKNKTHTHTQYTHTSCGKKECLFTQHSFDG